MLTLGSKASIRLESKATALVLNFSVKARIVLILLLALGIASKTSSQPAAVYDSTAKLTTVGQPDQVIGQIDLSTIQFSKPSGNRINFGLVGSEYRYILLKLSSEFPLTDQCLCIDNTSLDTVNIYRINGGTSRLLYQGGGLVVYNTRRDYVWHTLPVEISTTPSFYLIALKAAQKNIKVTYQILNKDHLQKKYHRYERYIFFYTDVISMIALIILLAFFLFKKAVFAAYLGYIFCVSGWILSHYGWIFPLLYPNHPVINEVVKPISTLGGCLFFFIVLYLVFRQQLESHQWLLKLIKEMLYVLPVLTGLMLLLLVSGLNANIKFALIAGWQIGMIFSFCLIIFIPLYLFSSGSTAKIFSAAMLVIGMMAIVQSISTYDYINNFFITEHGMTAGSLLEISIMAFGLFNSLLEDKRHKEIQVLALEQEQMETLKKLITVQDNERKRIAGDLHDNIGPLLAALKINFRRFINTKEGDPRDLLITKTESIIDDSIAEIRNVAHNLMPKGLSSNGLINTLSGYFESIQQLYNKTIVFDHEIQSVLLPDLQMNVYRIICELVLNAARHSEGQMIKVSLVAEAKWVLASIHDDGQGFNPKAGDQKTSLGLQSAESRVLYLKGKFILKTAPGMGTVIDIELPL